MVYILQVNFVEMLLPKPIFAFLPKIKLIALPQKISCHFGMSSIFVPIFL
jgi:hypothetical protein